jgi:nucleotide-binding universal stress UspA family protein
MYTRMLIPLDGSKNAEQVLPYARLLTSRFKLPVELLTALDLAELDLHVSIGQSPSLKSLLEDDIHSSEEYLQRIAGTFEGANVQCRVDKRSPAAVILERGQADCGMLIAMATHGRSGVNRWLLGSVAEKVLRATANALLLVRASDQSNPFKSILVPLDGSELAESVLPAVAGFAKKLELPVILLRVYSLPASAFMFGHGYYGLDMTAFMTLVKDDARDYLEKKAAEIKALGVDDVSCVTKEGLGADEIIKLASEASDRLIALCSHGRSGVSRWVLGSVTETVVRHTANPVLVLRAK